MHLILIDAERSPITYAILLPDILFKVLCRPLVLFIGFDIDINNLKRRYNNLHHHKGQVFPYKYRFKVCKQDFYILCNYLSVVFSWYESAFCFVIYKLFCPFLVEKGEKSFFIKNVDFSKGRQMPFFHCYEEGRHCILLKATKAIRKLITKRKLF